MRYVAAEHGRLGGPAELVGTHVGDRAGESAAERIVGAEGQPAAADGVQRAPERRRVVRTGVQDQVLGQVPPQIIRSTPRVLLTTGETVAVSAKSAYTPGSGSSAGWASTGNPSSAARW